MRVLAIVIVMVYKPAVLSRSEEQIVWATGRVGCRESSCAHVSHSRAVQTAAQLRPGIRSLGRKPRARGANKGAHRMIKVDLRYIVTCLPNGRASPWASAQNASPAGRTEEGASS